MKTITIASLYLAFVANAAIAQQIQPTRAGSPSPSKLAELVLSRFASGTPEEFARVFPYEEGRALVSQAVRDGQERRPGIGRVVWSGQHRAVLALSGVALTGNSGDETISSRAFSGFYEATEADGAWTITRRLPLDEKNRIRSHDLDVTISPGEGLSVTDTMQIAIGDEYGFAIRLNHRAKFSEVRLDGRAVEYEFGGGLIWVQAAPRPAARLKLSYSIEVERNPAGAGPGDFLASAGHVRNEYFWHPFFDFASSADLANFTVSVHIPAAYHVATSIPQTDVVKGDVRTVRGRSSKPTFALSLLYDKDWQVVSEQFGGLRFETFLTSDFQPPRALLEAVFRRTYDLLSSKFGAPRAEYFGVAQSRTRRGGGWHYRTNDLIVAGVVGGQTSSRSPRPRAYFGHEVSHGWTAPTGPATNFLMEGWATYAESLLLSDEFGADVERDFWESQRNNYYTGGFDGRSSILNDPDNGGVAYGKGAWILRMLHDFMGDAAFTKGMRDYMKIMPGEPAGLEEFLAAMTRAAGRDIKTFLNPWVTEKLIPDISTRVDGKRLLITQTGPVFELPLEVELVTANGTARRTIQLSRREEALEVGDLGAITEIRVDPEHRLLIQRHKGEVLHLELRAPEAKKVEVGGDFTSKPVQARLSEGAWRIDLPLTEGRYFWYWVIDGKIQQTENGKQAVVKVQTIRPMAEISSSYPR